MLGGAVKKSLMRVMKEELLSKAPRHHVHASETYWGKGAEERTKRTDETEKKRKRRNAMMKRGKNSSRVTNWAVGGKDHENPREREQIPKAVENHKAS